MSGTGATGRRPGVSGYRLVIGVLAASSTLGLFPGCTSHLLLQEWMPMAPQGLTEIVDERHDLPANAKIIASSSWMTDILLFWV